VIQLLAPCPPPEPFALQKHRAHITFESSMALATPCTSPEFENGPAKPRLVSLREQVMEHWERETRARVEGADELRRSALVPSMSMLFDEVAASVAIEAPANMPRVETVAAAHGVERARQTSFSPVEIAHEFQIFRQAIFTVAEGPIEFNARQWRRVDGAIDDAMRAALRAFSSVQEQARRKVAATLAHDMRTPLAVIANGAQLLGISLDSDKAKTIAGKIENNATRMHEMISELLNALTFQGDAALVLKPSQFDALDLLREVRDQYVEEGGGQVAFEAGGDSTIGCWCRDALRRLLENLVNNALKYGDGASVKMAVRENRNRLIISVNNSGAAIPKEQRERIFDYLRRDNNVSAVPGWGIGLQFVKAVAEAHGGDVSVDSSPGRGTTFFVQLPLDCRPHIEEDSMGAPPI
jgi:signal transduction histidine kinase